MNIHEKDGGRHRARLFRNGRSQAVRIPKEFEFEVDEVIISQDEDGRLTLEAVRRKPSLLDVLAGMQPLSPEDRFPELGDEDLLPLDDVSW